MEMKKSSINWFEIPVTDYSRANKFYSTVLGSEVKDYQMPDPNVEYGVFPYSPQEGTGGAIVKMEGLKPSQEGVIIYLNAGDDLSDPLSRVEAAGGKIIIPKTSIGENGYMAHFIDTEGNRIALHSMN